MTRRIPINFINLLILSTNRYRGAHGKAVNPARASNKALQKRILADKQKRERAAAKTVKKGGKENVSSNISKKKNNVKASNDSSDSDPFAFDPADAMDPFSEGKKGKGKKTGKGKAAHEVGALALIYMILFTDWDPLISSSHLVAPVLHIPSPTSFCTFKLLHVNTFTRLHFYAVTTSNLHTFTLLNFNIVVCSSLSRSTQL